MERVKTGIEGMDKLLDGGFPDHTAILVSGSAGCGKTLLGLSYLLEGARNGEKCLYISLNETQDELVKACVNIKALDDIGDYKDQNLVIWHTNLGFDMTLKEFTRMFLKYPQIDRCVIDDLNKIMISATKEREYRLRLSELIRYLKERSKTAMILCEAGKDMPDSGHGESFESDGVIKMGFAEFEEKPKRTIELYKMRYTPIEPRVAHELIISDGGLTVTDTKIL